jgi:hypothetical protein
MHVGELTPTPPPDNQYGPEERRSRSRKPQTDMEINLRPYQLSQPRTTDATSAVHMVPPQRMAELNDRILDLKLKLKEALGNADAERREKQRLLEQNNELAGELNEVRRALKDMQLLFFKNVQHATEQMTRNQEQRSSQVTDIMNENKELDQKVRELTLRLRNAEYQSTQPHAAEDRNQRLKQSLDNAEMQLESFKREISNLKDENRELQSLLSESRKSRKRVEELDENMQAQILATQQKATVAEGLREQLQVSHEIIARQREELKVIKQERLDTLSVISKRDEIILELRETLFKEKESKLQAQSEKRIVEAELQLVMKSTVDQPFKYTRPETSIEDEKLKREIFANDIERERLREENNRLRVEKSAMEAALSKKEDIIEQFRHDLFEEKQNVLKSRNDKRILEIEIENLRCRKEYGESSSPSLAVGAALSPDRIEQLFAKIAVMESIITSPIYGGITDQGMQPFTPHGSTAAGRSTPGPAKPHNGKTLTPVQPRSSEQQSGLHSGPSPNKANRPILNPSPGYGGAESEVSDSVHLRAKKLEIQVPGDQNLGGLATQFKQFPKPSEQHDHQPLSVQDNSLNGGIVESTAVTPRILVATSNLKPVHRARHAESPSPTDPPTENFTSAESNLIISPMSVRPTGKVVNSQDPFDSDDDSRREGRGRKDARDNREDTHSSRNGSDTESRPASSTRKTDSSSHGKAGSRHRHGRDRSKEEASKNTTKHPEADINSADDASDVHAVSSPKLPSDEHPFAVSGVKANTLLRSKSSKKQLESAVSLKVADITPAVIASANAEQLSIFLERAQQAAEMADVVKGQVRQEAADWTDNYKTEHGHPPKQEDRPLELKQKYRQVTSRVNICQDMFS